ncbi:ABC transporter permease [Magnetococcales bacterium HHB-1]
MIPTWGFIQVWRRHLLVWRKTVGASLAGSLGEPLLYLLGMGYGLGHLIGTVEGIPYLVYVGAGILAANSMNVSTFESLYGAFTRMTRQNTFHAMLFTPLTVADVVAGEVVWAATKALFSATAIFLVGSLFNAFPGDTALLALPIVFISGLVFSSFAMVMTALSPNYEYFLYYTTLATTPMFLFCGIFYPIATLPATIRLITDLLPLTHVISLIRPLTVGLPPEQPLYHLTVLILYGTLAFSIAVMLIRRRIII